ncbi:BadF/BadG/BcrA/BcrD ATPase family protein [Riemerella columbipharyngis]|uniref:BadF-type ATPase n=1 Tax=Riemerella columbipharyngis TaxID=1071918 RepID=A0A1G7C1U8_9FLAO|nr:BadF/BadG/BcrA/BcrD ATPase family protein [Riemerella columbipharyngis]SDE33302.1 BadF-type ATPase [Riemerella columbipharyngis]
MIAIVDGGSTKCDWKILDESHRMILQTETIGFNPNSMDVRIIASEIAKNQWLSKHQDDIRRLFFYGAGCGMPENAAIVAQQLRNTFGNAEVQVEDDLTAAVYAAYRGNPTIVCILGTGSNSCYFDGKNIKKELPSLGFLLGDEGSGCAMGKHLLRRFFMKKLPSDLHQEFEETYHPILSDTIKKCYHDSRANAYLASFNEFIVERKKHPYFQNMVFDEIKNFLDYHVLPYEEARSVEINFIGSVSYFYKDIVIAAAAELNLTVGTIVQKPIESLLEYHRKYIF